MKPVLVFLCLVAIAVPAGAQELDIFDINDFVDPRELGARAEGRGRLRCPCDPFFISRAMAGGVTRYVDVLRPTNTDVTFLHLATSYYRGPWQFNWKHTRLNADDFGLNDAAVAVSLVTPENKNTVQAARYFAFGSGDSALIGRAELTWTMVEYRQERRVRDVREFPEEPPLPVDGYESRYQNELGLEADIPWRLGRIPLVTSAVYVGRFRSRNISEALTLQRATLLQRLPRLTMGRWSLDPSIAVGTVISSARLGRMSILPSLHLISPTIPRADIRFHLRYAPSIERRRIMQAGDDPVEWSTASQIALFIDRAVYAKRFRGQ